MDEPYFDIKQSDLDEIAAQLSLRGTSPVKIAILQAINQGKTARIFENGAVVFQTNSGDEFDTYLNARTQPVPEGSPLLKNRTPAIGPTSPSK